MGDFNPFKTVKEDIDYSPKVGDEVKFSTCYMCACRCGIKVHMKDGKPRYIEGNPDHPVNKGVLCAKGSSGIMHWNAPGKLTKPLLRVGERGSGEFKEIEWDEAMDLAAKWLGETRAKDPSKLAFFTGRDQSQSLTGWWAGAYGTHNFAAHGGFCSVNMAAGGLYTLGGAFWEFGDPDFDRTKYFMMLGVADDHDSNPIKAGLGKMKTRGDCKFVAVNPSRNGYGAIADEWVGIRPGTDGLFIFAIIHELLRAEKVDFASLARYSNAPWLVIDNPGEADHGLFLRNKKGEPLIWDLKKKKAISANSKTIAPAFAGERKVLGKKVVPSFAHLAVRYLAKEYAPDAVAEQCGIPADTIRRIAAELAHAAFEEEVVIEQPWTDAWGNSHDKMIGRPVAIHAMRGISAHSNGFHTCRAIHMLQALLGSVDTPGGWRYKPPFPKPIPPAPKPTKPHYTPDAPLGGPPAGFPTDPSHLIVDDEGQPLRIDKAFSWEHPLSLHGMMHMVLRNAAKHDPYGVDVLFMFMANMAWNSSMNIPETLEFFTAKGDDGEYKIPKIIYSDAFYSETVPYCDLILPDTTYLERYDSLSVLDRPFSQGHGVADGIRQPVIELDRDVRTFQSVILELGAMLKLPGMVNDDGSPTYPGGYPDYLVNHERKPGIGPLAGWRGKNGDKFGRGEPNPKQLEKYIENGCFWEDKMPMSKQFFKHANQEYLEYAAHMGWIGEAKPIVHQLYNEDIQRFRLAAQGHGDHQPPKEHRERIETYFDPLPMWYKPFEERDMDASGDIDEFPIHALSQRPMHMYHSWGSQNTWLRQITNVNKLHIHKDLGADLGIVDDDWVWIAGRHGRVKGQVKLITGVNKNTVWTWNAMGKRKGAWGLKHDAPEFNQAFLLNHIISDVLKPNKTGHEYSNSDPVTGQAAWYDLRVKITKCAPEEFGFTEPMFEAPNGPVSDKTISAYGKGMQGTPTSGRAEVKEWIGQRHENAGSIPGIKDGHGNKVDGDGS